MSKLFKRILTTAFVGLFSISLMACSFNDVSKILSNINTMNNNQTGQNTDDVVAKLNSALIGEYVAEGVTIKVLESKIIVTDKNGSLEFTLYAKDDEVYIYVDGIKIVCTISNDKLSNSIHGEFDKAVVAKLGSDLTGTYSADGVTVEVSESKVSIIETDGDIMELTIYVSGDTYYVIEEGVVAAFTFDVENGSVTNAFGDTFYKNGSSSTGATVAHIDASLRGEYSNGEGTTVFVQESKVIVSEATGNRMEYDLYIENNRIYFESRSQKYYCDFGADGSYVRNDFGTFYKKNSGSGSGTIINEPTYGEYYKDGLYCVVMPNSFKITNNNDYKVEYVAYYENGEYYYMEGDKKVVCVFGIENGDEYFTNEYGKFTKTHGNEQGGGEGTNYTPANLNPPYLGTYKGNGMTIEVVPAKVFVTDSSNKTTEYIIHVENGSYFILENGQKVTCTFASDGSTVTNIFGTFTKESSQGGDTYTTAKLDPSLTGTYADSKTIVVVQESQVLITGNDGKTDKYTLYIENNTYFVLVNKKKIICTFGDGYVQNEFGKFIKQNSSSEGGSGEGGTQTYVAAHLSQALTGKYVSVDRNTMVFVRESSVGVIEATGRTMEYDLYVNASNEFFFFENGTPVICTFAADGTSVSNKHGTFYKEVTGGDETGSGSQSGDESGSESGSGSTVVGMEAILRQEMTGKFSSGSYSMFVSETEVSIARAREDRFTSYKVYITNDGEYYITYNGETIVLRFSSDYNTISCGTLGEFTRIG